MNSKQIAVVGAGAIGGAIAADLSGHDLLLCTRTPFERLVVTHPGGREEVEARVALRPETVAPVHWVLLATKAYQSETARPWLRRLCDTGTRVAVLQNGVDHRARVRPLVPSGVEVLPVVVQLPAERISPGQVIQERDGTLIVPDDAIGHEFADLFDGARTRVLPHRDFVAQAWWKLLGNAAMGAVCALTVREMGVVADPEIRQIVTQLMGEIIAVAHAEGVDLPEDAAEKALRAVLAGAPDHFTSIAVDRREGRPMEWEVRNAVVGRLGRRHQIPTPMNDLVTSLLRVADKAAPDGNAH